MARKLCSEFSGACCHVLNPGNYRRDLFATDGSAEGAESGLVALHFAQKRGKGLRCVGPCLRPSEVVSVIDVIFGFGFTWAEIEQTAVAERAGGEALSRTSDAMGHGNPHCQSLPVLQFSSMSTVQEIKSAIERLTLETQAELIADLCGWSDDDWDRQMKADAAAGKFAALNEESDRAIRSDQGSPLDAGLDRP